MMLLVTSFQVALNALRQHAMRSVLAMLGVIIGVASVIVMVSISNGARQVVDDQIQRLGSNQVMLLPGESRFGGRSSGAGSAQPFTDSDLYAIRESVWDVAHASGFVRGNKTLVAGGINWSTTIYGVQSEYLDVRDWPLDEGRIFGENEILHGGKVAIVGRTIADKLMPGGNTEGATIRIGNVPFQIIGVLEEKGQTSFGNDQDDLVLVPASTARRRLFGQRVALPDQLQTIMIEATSAEALPRVEEAIKELMRARRNIRPGQPEDFNVHNMAEFVRARTATQNTLGVLLGATAAISLVVGGIGIMNIMLVSVTERTREIGIRMAIGASRPDVLTQFLIEAVTLCGLGGAIGVALGVAGTFAVASFGAMPVVIDPVTIAGALASAVLVGVGFGFYPARRASRLNPIDALRHD